MSAAKQMVLLLVAELNAPGDQDSSLWNSLPEHDRDRALAIRNSDDRKRFILGRRLLQRAYSTLTGGAPLPPVETREGKPRLSGSDFDFSISHSASAVAVSMACSGRVGLDVEKRQPMDPQSIAVVFSDAELAHFEKLTKDEVSLACIDAWTTKEAIAKFLACPTDLDVRHLPASDSPLCRIRTWDLNLAQEKYRLCLAYEGEPEIFLQKERT